MMERRRGRLRSGRFVGGYVLLCFIPYLLGPGKRIADCFDEVKVNEEYNALIGNSEVIMSHCALYHISSVQDI